MELCLVRKLLGRKNDNGCEATDDGNTTEGEQVGTELADKETVSVCQTINDGDTTDVDGELNVAG